MLKFFSFFVQIFLGKNWSILSDLTLALLFRFIFCRSQFEKYKTYWNVEFEVKSFRQKLDQNDD